MEEPTESGATRNSDAKPVSRMKRREDNQQTAKRLKCLTCPDCPQPRFRAVQVLGCQSPRHEWQDEAEREAYRQVEFVEWCSIGHGRVWFWFQGRCDKVICKGLDGCDDKDVVLTARAATPNTGSLH